MPNYCDERLFNIANSMLTTNYLLSYLHSNLRCHVHSYKLEVYLPTYLPTNAPTYWKSFHLPTFLLNYLPTLLPIGSLRTYLPTNLSVLFVRVFPHWPRISNSRTTLKVLYIRPVAVAQLVKRLLQTPQIRSSNPDIGIFYLLSTVIYLCWKNKNKEKRDRELPIKTVLVHQSDDRWKNVFTLVA